MRTAAVVLLVSLETAHAAIALAAGPAGASGLPDLEADRSSLEHAARTELEPDRVGEALFHLAEMDEGKGDFARALEEDAACLKRAAGTRWAATASDRVAWLRARSEGGFAPLARLERVRRDPAMANDPLAVEALARDAEQFPPGPVRVEARMLVAEAWIGRFRRPNEGLTELRRVVGDPEADPLTARLAEREIVETLEAGGDEAQAAAEARSHRAGLDPRFLRDVGRRARRVWLGRASRAVLATFGALAALALGRAWRGRSLGAAGRAVGGFAPVAGVFVVFLAVAGGWLASRYETGQKGPFLLLGAAALPLVLLARAWSAVGSRRPGARAARAALCATTVLATAFLLLDGVGPEYLEGFGL